MAGFVAFILMISISVRAEMISEKIYRNLQEAFSGENCAAMASAKDCPEKNNVTTLNTAKLKELSEEQFFNQLAIYEKDRLQCGLDYWSSLESGQHAEASAQKLMDVINGQLPKLNELRNKINALRLRNTTLEANIPRNIPADQLNNIPHVKAKLDSVNANKKEIEELGKIQELLLAQIPHTDIPDFRDFILDHAGPGLIDKNLHPIQIKDFKKIATQVKKGFLEGQKNLQATKKNDIYNLDAETREKLGTDDYLTGMLSRENPDSSALIKKYTCQAKARKSGREAVTKAANFASVALTGGALAVAKVGRVAFLAKYPRATAGLASQSRAMGIGSSITGGIHTYQAIEDTCLRSATAEVIGSCSQTPETILKQAQIGSCIFDVTMSIAGKVLNGGNSAIATNLIKGGKSADPQLVHATAAEALQVAKQKGIVTSDHWRHFAESGAKVNKDVSEAYATAFDLYKKEKRIPADPAQFNTYLRNMPERDLRVYEHYATITGQTNNLPATIKRRYQIVKEDLGQRFGSREGNEIYENTFAKEISEIRTNTRSPDPQIAKQAEEMLKAFKVAFPGMR